MRFVEVHGKAITGAGNRTFRGTSNLLVEGRDLKDQSSATIAAVPCDGGLQRELRSAITKPGTNPSSLLGAFVITKLWWAPSPRNRQLCSVRRHILGSLAPRTRLDIELCLPSPLIAYLLKLGRRFYYLPSCNAAFNDLALWHARCALDGQRPPKTRLKYALT